MPTTTITAGSLKSASSSSWSSDNRARQGVYSSTRYEGAMLFSGLSGMAFGNIAISEIKMKLTFADAGGSSNKYVTLYEGAKDTISGSIASMRGNSIGAVSVADAYNAARTITFSSGSNAAMFTKLVSFFAGGGKILILYVPTTRGTYSGGYCYDYLSITKAELTFTYEYLQSTGTPPTSVAAGGAATLNITSFNSAYTHKVVWKFGSNAHTQSVAAGATSASYTIPLSWLSAIPSTKSGAASVSLETVGTGGASLGTYTYNFTITAPASVVPTIGGVTASPVNDNAVLADWGIYAQGKSKANLAIIGAAGAYGSTIQSYSITTSPSIGAASGASMQTGTINATGTVAITGTVTDSRGYTASKTTTISVYAYAAPSFTPVSVYRCTSNGTRNDTDGTYVYLKCTFGRSALSGGNNVTGSVTVKQVGGSYTAASAITSGTGIILGGGSIAIDATYTATFTITDTVGTVTTYVDEISSAAYILHVKKGGKAIGFGMAAGADNTASFGWKVLASDAEIDTLRMNTYTSVAQLGQTVGAATINGCRDAMPNGSQLMAQASDFASGELPSTIGTVLIGRIHNIRSYCLFMGKEPATGIFKQALDSAGTAFTGVWYRVYDAASVIPISGGGTGQTTAAAARNALGLGNTTGAVPVANGGTGATTAAGALTNLGISGALVVSASGNSGNHHYLRFSNGLQVCYGTHSWSAAMTTSLGSIYLTDAHGSFSFPVPFTSVISATATKRGSTANSGLYRMGSSTTGLSGIAMFRGNSASTAATQEIDYFVIGKWN
jgi:hypothetical protein